MSTTPEWEAVDRAVNGTQGWTWVDIETSDSNGKFRAERIIAKKRKRIIVRAVIAVVSLVLGVATGTVVATVVAPDSDAVSQTTINQYIRANGGIPPCKEEDGSGQPGKCYWDAAHRGDGNGHPAVLVPVPGHPGADKTVVWLDTHSD